MTAKRIILSMLLLILSIPIAGSAINNRVDASFRVPILLYHRFGPMVADSMTLTTPVFRSHLEYLKTHGYTVIPLRQLVNYYLRKGSPPPPKSVVITVDDGHNTVYSEMLPLVKEYHIPVTLFIYPSAISNASYALTWNQLRELQRTGLFDIQSHTFWHPNFKRDRGRMNKTEFEESVDMQMIKSKAKLEKELGTKIDMLAWPFGIYDDFLIARASAAGYVAAFTLDHRSTDSSDKIMTLPRYLLTDANRGRSFEWIFETRGEGKSSPNGGTVR